MAVVQTLKENWKRLIASPYSPFVLAVVLLLVVAVILYFLGWLGPLVHNGWFQVALLLSLGIGTIVMVQWGIPWLREWIFMREEGSRYAVAGQESPEEFRAKFAKAVQVLKTLPQLKGRGDPLYVLPWYVVLGEAGSGKTAAVTGAGTFSALLPAAGNGSGTQNFDCWVSNAAFVIDTAGRYAIQVDATRDRLEWYRLLRLLRHRRDREPVNGIIVTIGVDDLISQSEDALRAKGSKLRERIEEAVRELGIDFPVYIVITKCDRIEGFAEFFRELPERMLSEVMGYVDESAAQPAQRGAPAQPRLAAGLESIYGRLHTFRLGIFEGKATDAQRQGIFCFPEEFRSLERPLMAFVEAVSAEDVRYHTPFCRGIFFTSAEQQGARASLLRRQLDAGDAAATVSPTTKRYFLTDLFDSIIPRDAALVSTTARGRRRRGMASVFRNGGAAAVVLLLVFFAARAFFIDRRITASVDPQSCPADAAAGPAPRLDAAERCWRAVDALSEQNARRSHWSTWLFNRSGPLEQAMRERYVKAFQTMVLTPLNTELERSFQATPDPLPLMLLVARRIQLSRRCLSPEGCTERTAAELQPDFPLMLNPRRDRSPPANDLAIIARAYPSYLLWQSDEKTALQQDVVDDQKRLRQWLTARQFSLESLLPLVNKRAAPITSEDYWELPAPITTVAAAQIDGACVRKVWEQDIGPFLEQLQDAVPDATPQLRAFQQQYRTTCFAQWERFLKEFPRGAERWRGADRQRTLALRLLTEQSPYSRVLDAAATNLAPWLSAQGDAASGGWADELKVYLTAPQRNAYQEALKKIAGRLDPDSLPEASFKIAQEAFIEGKPSQDSASPVLRAWWIASHDGPEGASRKSDSGLVAALLQEWIRYVWRVILQEAGLHLQKAWGDTVLAPLKGLPPADQLLQLYGPGGKAGAFVEQFLRPFWKSDEPEPAAVMGERLPFSPRFLEMVSAAKELKPLLEGGGPAQVVRVRASRRTEIDGRSAFVEEQTVFSVTCSGKVYRATNRSPDPTEFTASIPWSSQGCGDVAVTIYLAERDSTAGAAPGGARRVQLTKRYAGQGGFLQFAQDFMDGSERFQKDDFAGADPDAWDALKYGVNAIVVYYSVEAPPALSKLITSLQRTALPDDVVAPSRS